MTAAVEEITSNMVKILEKISLESNNDDKKDTVVVGMEKKESMNGPETPSPVLLAAKSGIKEMVERILQKFPEAILDQDMDDKNIVLLAAEHRQVRVYKFMLGAVATKEEKEHVFGKVDKEGNTALHLAANLSHNGTWTSPGAAFLMQWEHKWFKFVHTSMDREIFTTTNHAGKTAHQIFLETHRNLVNKGSEWLINASQSCSVVAALVATVAFASVSQVPGGVDQDSGFPVLGKKPAFQLFAISSLVALCSSVTSLIMLLAIFTSRYQARDFETRLPVRLFVSLTSLYMSIVAMLVSFCAGDFFIVEQKLKFVAYTIYAVICFPVTFFCVTEFPLYIDLIKATISEVPERTEMMQAY